ncbi:nuclear transport factor 2 family protein [Amycolatopsis sp. NPDC021455]|uniref:nuclear transport factor 2 family protein n=1 Tax=Amycolatopsis sp. NPDC021455 TaxID=3154901 RepID=UPI0033DCC2DA
MAPAGAGKHARPSAAAGAFGIDHVRLSYHYLDIGDLDGYGSLFTADAVLHFPGMAPIKGRRAIERFRAARSPAGHTLQSVTVTHGEVVVNGVIAAIGPNGGSTNTAFVDSFTLSDYGLIEVQKTDFGSGENSRAVG